MICVAKIHVVGDCSGRYAFADKIITSVDSFVEGLDAVCDTGFFVGLIGKAAYILADFIRGLLSLFFNIGHKFFLIGLIVDGLRFFPADGAPGGAGVFLTGLEGSGAWEFFDGLA